MSSTAKTQVFTAVHTIGALIPADMLLRIAEGKDVSGSTPADYQLIGARSVRDEAERHWDYLKGVWRELRTKLAYAPDNAVPADPTGHAQTQWLEPLFAELGFGRLTRPAAGITSDDGLKTFPISHRWQHVPIHLTAWNTDLDKRPGGAGTVPPQSLIQECLNRTGGHLWAVLSNGRQLRLLRDSTSLAGAAYVEFDLEAIFDGELFSEFVLLYRLLHVSRFEVPDGAAPSASRLEKWRTEAIESGVRALEQLRKGVEDAITTLGTGFLRHPRNAALRDTLDTDALRDALLRLVYRMLFLFVAEDRGALLHPDADETAQRRYRDYFSSARLRHHAQRRRGTAHGDLYQALRVVLDGLGSEDGRPELGLPGLGGIFDDTEADAPLHSLELANEDLLTAVRALSVVRDSGAKRNRSVDYQHLGAEELGSVYESLLELVPKHDPAGPTFELVELPGNARKTTGSYYTPTSLIDCLLDSALDPVIDDAVKRGEARAAAADQPDPRDAIADELLSLTVCDPACGSGHFLVAAARRIAKHLAAVREQNPEPTVDALRHALREVTARCIYGVDLNPMAVELAKVSLWMEALEPGKPLGFLDAHIKGGNALMGATPELLAEGIPDDAFKPIEGDDKKFVADLKKINAKERAGQDALFHHSTEAKALNTSFATTLRRITAAQANTLRQVRLQSAAYRTWEQDPVYLHTRHVADAWCAAFVSRKTPDAPPPVTDSIYRGLQDPEAAGATAATNEEIVRLSGHYRFFHWHLEFPEVFEVHPPADAHANTQDRRTGGFSCILGNPPWDTLSPDEKEFFSTYDPSVRAMKKDEREAAVSQLLLIPTIRESWERSRRDLYALVHFLKSGGRYRLFAKGNLGKGDFNVYRMFVETAFALAEPGGSVAQVTPSGIYNGANAQAIREELFDHWTLMLMMGLINTGEGWFRGADATMRFAAYTARRFGRTTEFSAAFQIKNPNDLMAALDRPHRLSVEVVKSQSPDALAISDTAGGIDAAVTDHLYLQWPAFAASSDDFPKRVYQREIDMGTDRDRYTDDEPGLPLYEGRMVAQYDHRAKAYVSGRGRSAVWHSLEFGDQEKAIIPQWVVPERKIPNKVMGRIHRFRLGFCNVASPRNERSLVAAIIPPNVICGDPVPTILFEDGAEWPFLLWLATANSLVLDFLARKKITLHVQLGVLDSLPFPRLRPGHPILDHLAPLVLRLTCTSPEMTPFWNRMAEYGWTSSAPEGQVPAEALLDDTDRAEVRAEIDAIVAKLLFRLSRAELEHIVSTFPTLERNEQRLYGRFRTRELTLRAFDRLASSDLNPTLAGVPDHPTTSDRSLGSSAATPTVATLPEA
ncbi:Eco57I restriction-modification methylase domain-containing protein [Kitasatospora sp. NBC_01539]|uniref:Eco57I restriction-modification methylase domain-containing protein n=1 Tax=Kitasatospora sp. NBC_01539 TaxID=2903577 RepID=UPI0038602291